MSMKVVEKEFKFRGKEVKVKIKLLNYFEFNDVLENCIEAVMIGNKTKTVVRPFKQKNEVLKACFVEGPFKLEELSPIEGNELYKIIEEENKVTYEEKKN